ncbi:MAG: hypothetical protein Q9221_007998 [Calogaya cf. arnoldii]
MSPNIASFPLELIASIMAASPDFYNVIALRKTSRIFQAAWVENWASICQAILPRCEPCLDNADRLARLQQEHARVPETFRIQRLVLNTRVAHELCELYIESVLSNMPSRYRRPYLTSSERERLHEACYGVWTALHLSSADMKTEDGHSNIDTFSIYLNNTPLRSLHRCAELARWLWLDFGRNQKQLDWQARVMETCMPEAEEVEKFWENVMERIWDVWYIKHEQITGRSGLYWPDDASLQMFTIFDEY